MTTIATPVSAKAMHLDVRGYSPADIIPDALIMQVSTKAGVIGGDEPAVRVPFIDFSDDVGFVAEGEPIEEADPAYSEVVIHSGKVATLARVSQEQMYGQNAAELVTSSMRRALTAKANTAFVAQAAPTPPATNPPGGLLSLDHTVGGIVDTNLDDVVGAVSTIEAAGGSATHIIASPGAWASVSRIKTGTGSEESLIGAGTAAPQRSLLGVPVLVTPAMPAGTLLVVDRSAILSAYGDVRLAISQDVYFATDSIGVRLTFRFGQKLVDPARVVELTVADGES